LTGWRAVVPADGTPATTTLAGFVAAALGPSALTAAPGKKKKSAVREELSHGVW
jgi:hypothetical protein